MKTVAAAMIVVACSVFVTACSDDKSPTAPSTPTRVITVTGDLAFGNVNIGETATRTFTIGNTGNSPLTYTSLRAVGGTGTDGYAASPTTGTVPAGGSIVVTMRFSPVIAQFYSHVLNVIGDQTGGGNAINVSGFGVNNNPIFTRAGVGDNVFDLPSYVTRIRVDATYGGSCQNFIVRVNGSSIINTIIGTCSVADTRSPFSGTYALAGGGQVSIVSSTGIQWTFTEVR